MRTSAIPGLSDDLSTGSGNAWLLREERDGTVELIVGQSRRLRAQRADRSDTNERNSTALPSVDIAPADLDKDIKKFTAALAAGAPGTTRPGISDLDGDDSEDAEAGAGEALLFLAHLHRQGRVEFARKLLPDLLARAATPEAALDGAISLVADSRLAQATADWCARGDATAYAKTIEALSADFSRGWRNRDAALLLAQRVRMPVIPRTAQETAAKKAAALFLALKPEQFGELPIGRNWLLPGSAATTRSYRGMRVMVAEDDLEEEGTTEQGESGRPAGRGSPVTTFLAGRRAVLAPLAKLLGDQRLLRVPRSSGDGISRSFQSDEESPEAALKQAYEALPRPYEVGEIVAVLLEPLLPEEVRSSASDGGLQSDVVLAWAAQIARLSDEELAWDYLRRANHSYEESFHAAMGWLVRSGNAASLAKLQDVFCDPAVWTNGGEYRLLPLLTIYLKRFGGDSAAFGDKVMTAFKAAINEQQLERSSSRVSLPDDMKKEYARQTEGQLKQLEQILKPRSFADLLKDAAVAEGPEARTLVQTISAALAQIPWAEAEPQLFSAAANGKSAEIKHGLLGLISARGLRPEAAGGKPRTPVAFSAPTRVALETLLQDETESVAPQGYARQTVAQATATAIVWPRLTDAERQQYWALAQNAPEIAGKWVKDNALGIAREKPAQPLPGGANIAAERVQALIAELVTLPPEPLIAKFRTVAAEEQLAVGAHLRKLDQWPEPLVAAQFTITKVEGAAREQAPLDSFKGRRFDDRLRRELDAAIDQAAQAGRAFAVRLSTTSPLAGVTISCLPSRGLRAEQLQQMAIPGLNEKPAPIAVVSCSWQSGAQRGEMESWTTFVPIWQEPVRNEEWQREQAKAAISQTPSAANGEPERAANAEGSGTFDFRDFQKRLETRLAQPLTARQPFALVWAIMSLPKDSAP